MDGLLFLLDLSFFIFPPWFLILISLYLLLLVEDSPCGSQENRPSYRKILIRNSKDAIFEK
jgi:hypothetical protein